MYVTHFCSPFRAFRSSVLKKCTFHLSQSNTSRRFEKAGNDGVSKSTFQDIFPGKFIFAFQQNFYGLSPLWVCCQYSDFSPLFPLFGTSRQINKLNLCKSMIRAIDNLGINDRFSLAQRVTYCYYVGRKAMFDGDFISGQLFCLFSTFHRFVIHRFKYIYGRHVWGMIHLLSSA